MHAYFHHQDDIVNELNRTGSPDCLRKLWRSRTKEWKHAYISGEHHTWGTFADVTMRPDLAFLLVDEALDIALEQTDPDLLETGLSLILHLAALSDTTEKPRVLTDKLSTLVDVAERLGKSESVYVEELFRWYRIPRV